MTEPPSPADPPPGRPGVGRLGIYADLRYRRDALGVSSSTAFVRWLSGLGAHVGELIVFGRLDPVAGRAEHPLDGENVRFVPLPHYGSLRQLGKVVRLAARAGGVFERELPACDAVLLFGPHPYTVLFARRARRARVPVVVGVRQDFPRYLVHRSPAWRRPFAFAAGQFLEALHRRSGAGVVAVGEDVASRYRKARMPVLTTGISLVRSAEVVPRSEALERPWPGSHIVLTAGRLDPEKNPLLLPEIGRELRRLGPWTLVVAGGGTAEALLRARIATEALEDVVVLVGRLDRDALWRSYAEATLFLHVSRTEGLPQVLYEAAAMGLPIVATDVGGVAAALANGQRGILVPPDDAQAVREAVHRLARDPMARRRMVDEAHAWAASDNLDTQTARVVDFVGAVARPPRPARLD